MALSSKLKANSNGVSFELPDSITAPLIGSLNSNRYSETLSPVKFGSTSAFSMGRGATQIEAPDAKPGYHWQHRKKVAYSFLLELPIERYSKTMKDIGLHLTICRVR